MPRLNTLLLPLLMSMAVVMVTVLPVKADEASITVDTDQSAESVADKESEHSELAWDLSMLMQSLANNPASHVGFTETRHSDLLEQPLQITGELEYRPPDTLIRRIISPRPETFIIEDRHVTIERPRQNDRYLPLSAAPALEGLAQALRGVLGGKQELLEDVFAVQLSGKQTCWQLQLTPNDSDVGEEIAQLTIHGKHNQLRSFEIIEPDGDRAVVVLQPLVDGND